jgi:hypothetical protein
MNDFWLPCQKCGIGEFLIYGLCSKCDPELHCEWNKGMYIFTQITIAFNMETGKEPLEAWNEFEEFCNRKEYQL